MDAVFAGDRGQGQKGYDDNSQRATLKDILNHGGRYLAGGYNNVESKRRRWGSNKSPAVRGALRISAHNAARPHGILAVHSV